MARKPRVHAPGALYHVMLRGNAGADLFFSDRDRVLLEGLIAEGVARFAHRVHAYCWMTNHLHLAIQVGAVPLSKVIHNLAFRYAGWLNRQQGGVGHVFQRRYEARLIDCNRYLLTLVRYIHQNPVKAGIAPRPEDYPWSSHRAYLGRDKAPWLTTAAVLCCFGERVGESRRRFQAFVDEVVPGEDAGSELGEAESGALLPLESFDPEAEDSALTRTPPAPSLEDLCARVCHEMGVSPAELSGPSRVRRLARARHLIAWLALNLECGTLTDLARRFGRDPAALCRGVERIGKEIQSNADLRRKIARWSEAPPTSQ
ncbi:MAG: transposase [Deltaproteobacteria bacterium]|nr:transposase [Deltaproteobacteria bacterium]